MLSTPSTYRTTAPGSLAALLLLLLASPAAADVLVTRAGGRVEIQGHWQVKGKLVVFTQANGTLSSLRLADVDLPASEEATAQSKLTPETPPAAAKPERKKSVVSLTDADFSHKKTDDGTGKAVANETANGEKSDDKGAKDKSAQEQAKNPVEVSSWRQADRPEGDGLDVIGELKNTGPEMATNVSLKVELFNETNQSLGKADAVLSAAAIRAGGTITFRVPFPGVFTFSRGSFDLNSRSLTLDDAPENAGKKGETPPRAGQKPPPRG